MSGWAWRIALLALVLITLPAGAQQVDEGARLDGLLVGEMAQLQVQTRSVPDVAFNGADGTPMTLGAFAGKYVLVNFWAHWCTPCREEMPHLSDLQAEMGGEAFEVVTIAVGGNRAGTMESFLEEVGARNLPLHADPAGDLSGAMGVLALPVSVLINPDGQEIARFQGAADWASPEALELVRYLIKK